MKKQPTHIERDNVKIPVDHVLSFKTQKAFKEKMEEEGHFANETLEIFEKIIDAVWKEAHEIKEAAETENAKADAPDVEAGGSVADGEAEKVITSEPAKGKASSKVIPPSENAPAANVPGGGPVNATEATK